MEPRLLSALTGSYLVILPTTRGRAKMLGVGRAQVWETWPKGFSVVAIFRKPALRVLSSYTPYVRFTNCLIINGHCKCSVSVLHAPLHPRRSTGRDPFPASDLGSLRMALSKHVLFIPARSSPGSRQPQPLMLGMNYGLGGVEAGICGSIIFKQGRHDVLKR